ncbi:helix-turn-helix transcriptional regulator [Halocella sp. SP3-1]|uniref:helix-turn-helix domain-containing protein n=1 Tax=Halocella sp. SP3-1 TaxID=2382161 RepID=UPI000F762D13|nr:helix-turn-helix transcriptional regulator [Halocella sp. SP3-1]AZO96111.1 XRE family transcriptional regulator [Halocella sp. SP3-1]
MKAKCKVREILKDRGLSLKWLVDKTGICYEEVIDIIDMRYKHVYIENAYKIARALNMKISDVWEFEE